MDSKIPLGKYLWTRIRQLGVGSVMGVPGDMNLRLLDHLISTDGLEWVGNANELNAGYAADGYARVKSCPGVVVTTMGVGELSAINAIAGAYTENVKIIHIIGMTATHSQSKRLMIHHCLGSDPNHKIYGTMSQQVRCAHAWLDNAEKATSEIDRVIRECYIKSLPVYLYIPMDYVDVLVSPQPLSISVNTTPPVHLCAEERAVSKIVETISASFNPVVLVDALAARHNSTTETQELVDALKLPVFVTPMGKSIIDESHPLYCGTYNGQISLPGIKEAVESSDCVVEIGPIRTDCNTGGFTQDFSATQLISVFPDRCEVRGVMFSGVYMSSLLRKLLKRAETIILPTSKLPVFPPSPKPKDFDAKKIVQSWLWKRLGQLAKPKDIIIAEAGTAQFGSIDAPLPGQVKYITQVYYGSIGYSVGSCLGAALAQREMKLGDPSGRTILVVGDGSLQLTAQEIGTMVRLKLKPIIIIINNAGYTIERAIHGAEQPYNDITIWHHKALLELFGVRNSQDHYREARTKEDLERILGLPEYCSPKSIEILEIYMDQMDIPWTLKATMAALRRTNGS